MSTNTWVFSLPRVVLSGNPLKAKKVDSSARGLPMMQEEWGEMRAPLRGTHAHSRPDPQPEPQRRARARLTPGGTRPGQD